MKFSFSFALASLALSMLTSVVAGEGAIYEVELTSPVEDKDEAEAAADMTGMMTEKTLEPLIAGEGSTRHLKQGERHLQFFSVKEGSFQASIPSVDEFGLPTVIYVNYTSVNYFTRTFPCAENPSLPFQGTCFQVALTYRVEIYRDGDGNNVDDLGLLNIPADWREQARDLLRADLEATYGGKVYSDVKTVDDRFYVSTSGDPHFKTFSGAWFDYMGACDLKMLHAPSFDGEGKALDINIRTKIRYDYSYVEAAVLTLGDDVFEIGSFGEYFVNGIASAKMPATVGGYTVTHSSPSEKINVFKIQISATDSITLKNFKDMVAVNLDVRTPARLVGTVGMIGTFDRDGKMIGRDGVTEIADPNEFAAEWQIREDEPMLFNVASGPQHPAKCELPSPSAAKGRRLGETIALAAAEKACAKWAAENQEACVHDVMAIGDLDLAAAGAF